MSIEEYFKERDKQVKRNRKDKEIPKAVDAFFDTIHRTNYIKNFSWAGVPIMQLPTDLMAMQEIIWKVNPGYIIETGIAFGGMTRFYLDMCHLVSYGGVISIDIDIRSHARSHLKVFVQLGFLELIEGSSTDPLVFNKVEKCLGWEEHGPTLVSLDSNHTHDHVLQELNLYAPLVSVGSYIVVFDTLIEYLDPKYIKDRPWGKGNSPMTAVNEFLKHNKNFVADKDIENRILLTSAPGGWLKRIR